MVVIVSNTIYSSLSQALAIPSTICHLTRNLASLYILSRSKQMTPAGYWPKKNTMASTAISTTHNSAAFFCNHLT